VIALTDHDQVGALPPGDYRFEGRSLRLLAAAELTGTHQGQEQHLLVYFPGEPPTGFLDLCRQQSAERARRYQLLRQALNEPDLAPAPPEAFRGERALTRHHLARELVRLGRAGSLAEAFGGHLHQGGASLGTPLVDLIRWSRGWGGLTSWAHPQVQAAEAYLPALTAAGLGGLELHRPLLPEAARRRLRSLARQHGLWVTGGSDWHGWSDPDPGLLELRVGDLADFFDALRAA
jgi:hypothetical protein